MRRLLLSHGTAWILLFALLGTLDLVPALSHHDACACGMSVGCCCRTMRTGRPMHGTQGMQRMPEMPEGSACSMHRTATRCTLRSADGPALRSRIDPPVAGSSAWQARRLLLPPLDPRGSALPLAATALSSTVRKPVSPPPRNA